VDISDGMLVLILVHGRSSLQGTILSLEGGLSIKLYNIAYSIIALNLGCILLPIHLLHLLQ
jgi:hypothetical protein